MYLYKKLFKKNKKNYWLTQDKSNSKYSDILEDSKFIAEIDNKKNTITFYHRLDCNLEEELKSIVI